MYDFKGILDRLSGLKLHFHIDIEVENATPEETAAFFKECNKRGLIPRWLNDKEIRVTNCAGGTKLQKAVAGMSNEELSHIQGLLVAAGISATMKNSHRAFTALFERERAKAKKGKNEKREKLYRLFSEANPVQIEAILSTMTK